MVTHVVYSEERYERPEQCLLGIREHVSHGWHISQIRGPRSGPFLVLFRIEDAR